MRFCALALVSLLASLVTTSPAALPEAAANNQLETRATFGYEPSHRFKLRPKRKSLTWKTINRSFAGTNAYWLPFLTNNADIDLAFKTIAAAGLKVVRTWGFYDSTSCSGIHFQCWSSSTPSINYGAEGLQKMDAVVAAASKYGVNLIIPFGRNLPPLRQPEWTFDECWGI